MSLIYLLACWTLQDIHHGVHEKQPCAPQEEQHSASPFLDHGLQQSSARLYSAEAPEVDPESSLHITAAELHPELDNLDMPVDANKSYAHPDKAGDTMPHLQHPVNFRQLEDRMQAMETKLMLQPDNTPCAGDSQRPDPELNQGLRELQKLYEVCLAVHAHMTLPGSLPSDCFGQQLQETCVGQARMSQFCTPTYACSGDVPPT